jgi:hypothetical protein
MLGKVVRLAARIIRRWQTLRNDTGVPVLRLQDMPYLYCFYFFRRLQFDNGSVKNLEFLSQVRLKSVRMPPEDTGMLIRQYGCGMEKFCCYQS